MKEAPTNLTYDEALSVIKQYFPNGFSRQEVEARCTIADDKGVPISEYGSFVIDAVVTILNQSTKPEGSIKGT